MAVDCSGYKQSKVFNSKVSEILIQCASSELTAEAECELYASRATWCFRCASWSQFLLEAQSESITPKSLTLNKTIVV